MFNLNWFRKKRCNTAGIYDYHQGMILTNGAQEMVLQPFQTYPLQVVKGPGQYAGSLKIIDGPQLEYLYAAFARPAVQGNYAGMLYSQPLLDHEPAVQD